MRIRFWLVALATSLVALLPLGCGGGGDSGFSAESRGLGTLGGTGSRAMAINDAGQVVGWSTTAAGQTHAFLWTASGGMQDLGTLGGDNSTATDINSAGQVTGWAEAANGNRQAFRWTAGGGMQELGTLGGTFSEGNAINDDGQVVGWAQTASDNGHAFTWTAGGGMQDLGKPDSVSDEDFYGDARDINAAGQVVGYITVPGGGGFYPYRWTAGGGMQELALDIACVPEAVNSQGQVAGWYGWDTIPGVQTAFVWSGGDTQYLDTVTEEYTSSSRDISDSGQVVGDKQGRPFIWTAQSGLKELDDNGGAEGINGRNQVVGASGGQAVLWNVKF